MYPPGLRELSRASVVRFMIISLLHGSPRCCGEKKAAGTNQRMHASLGNQPGVMKIANQRYMPDSLSYFLRPSDKHRNEDKQIKSPRQALSRKEITPRIEASGRIQEGKAFSKHDAIRPRRRTSRIKTRSNHCDRREKRRNGDRAGGSCDEARIQEYIITINSSL